MFDWLLSLLSKLCKKPSANTTTPSTQPIKSEPKPADKVVASVEAAAPAPSEKITTTPEPVKPASQTLEVENKPVAQPINKVSIASPENSSLPQDSMLRRHYLTNLHTIVTSLSSARPSDSALSRHYEAQISAKIEQCVSNETAMTQLLSDYEACKKTAAPAAVKEQKIAPIVSKEEAQTIIEPAIVKIAIASESVAATSPKGSKIPQDSALRRHYITHLYAEAQANLPARPTDATLRRHYDAILESEVSKQLAE